MEDAIDSPWNTVIEIEGWSNFWQWGIGRTNGSGQKLFEYAKYILRHAQAVHMCT